MGDEAGQLTKGAGLGRYVVLGLIGRGGMGEVYAAYDPELDRKIAIKLLRAGADAAAAERGRPRLLREAQAIARLSHPNVVVVHDVGTFGDSVFIAMEFVQGHTLGYWLQSARRNWREVLDVYIAAGRGLAAAHAAGLIHRDFKPDNVMITKSGQVRVMDFGLAREEVADLPARVRQEAVAAGQRAAAIAHTVDDVDPDATAKLADETEQGSELPSGGYLQMKLTRTGAFMGTPAYMAPEQFSGEPCDARTDQFSFAVALWEALHDRAPFAGGNVVERMVNVVSGAIRDPPPDTRVPGWVRKILRRSLLVDRTQRYPSMGELLDMLTRDPTVRRKWWMAAGAVALLVAATGFGARRLGVDRRGLCANGPARASTAWDAARRREVERAFTATGKSNAAQAFATTAALIDEYVGRWTQLYTETCTATHVRGDQSGEVLDLRMDCLGERLASVHALGEVLSTSDAQVVANAVAAASSLPMLERCSDIPMLRAVVRPPEDPATRARVGALREEIAKVTALSSSGQCERATTAGEKLVTAASAIGYQPLTAEALLAVGRLGDTCSDPAKAVEQLEDASFAAEMSHHDQVVVEAAVFATGFYAERLHDLPTARRWLRHGEAVLARFPGHPILEGWMATARGAYLFAEGNNAGTIAEIRRALALLEKERGPGHLDVAICLQDLGYALYEDGQFAEAELATVRALGIMRRLFGDDSARIANAFDNHAKILISLGRFDEARARVDQALTNLRTQGAGRYFIGEVLLDRGRLELESGKPTEARATLIDAAQQLGRVNPKLAAEADFALARASWSLPAERSKAARLARQARETMAAMKGRARQVAEIDAWLVAHSEARR